MKINRLPPLLLLVAIVFIPFSTIKAQQNRIFGLTEYRFNGDSIIIKRLITQTIAPKDGMKIKVTAPPDSAWLFIPDDGFKYSAEITFRKIIPPPPPPVDEPQVVVEAGNFVTNNTGTVASAGYVVMKATTLLTYKVDTKGPKKKITFFYAMASTPNLLLAIKVNGVSKTYTLLPTGSWGVIKPTLTLDLPQEVNGGAVDIWFSTNRDFEFGRFVLSN